eukprot:gene15302-20618_t
MRLKKCSRINDCPLPTCHMLHRSSEIEAFMQDQFSRRTTPTPVIRAVYKARQLHNEKILKCDSEIYKLVGQLLAFEDVEQKKSKYDIISVKEKLRDELIMQRKVFDSTVWPLMKEINSSLDAKYVKSVNYHISREIYRLKNALPALALRGEVENVLQVNHFTVIQGATGSGKSTQLPSYFADMALFKTKKIICTQPRKLAATSLASRVAEEWSAGAPNPKAKEVGMTVGYRVGSLSKARNFTQIEYWTEGTFMTRLLDNLIDMSKVGVVILDEAHERSIALDVIIAILKSRHSQWPHLRVVVTSATLDTKLFSNYLNNCPILSIPGRMYPVEVVYEAIEVTEKNIVQSVVDSAWKIHCNYSIAEGDILCFLTGQAEVESAVEKFSKLVRSSGSKNAAAHALYYGKQLPEEQQVVVFEKAAINSRKESVYDARRNVTLLEEVRAISKSSADQRKGRAGRTRPGTCHRLYSQEDYEKMKISQQVYLAAKQIDATSFPWIEKPDPIALNTAKHDLELLNAFIANDPCDGSKIQLSSIGLFIDKLQIDPALALLIHRGCEWGCGEAAIILASMFTVASNLFWRGATDQEKTTAKEAHKKLMHFGGDAMTLFNIYNDWQKACDSVKEVVENGGIGMTAITAVSDDSFEQVELNSAAFSLHNHSMVTMGKVTFLALEQEQLIDAMYDDDYDDNEDDYLATRLHSKLTMEELNDESFESDGTLVDEQSVTQSTFNDLQEVSFEEKLNWKQQLKARKAAAKSWCLKKNYVNGKSLDIVMSMDEVELNIMLCKLVASSLYLNTAVLMSDNREYRVAKNDIPTVGFLHPSSSLSHLSDQMEPTRSFFSSLFQSSKPFLSNLTPVKPEEWIEEYAPQFFSDEIQPRLMNCVCSERLSFHVPKSLIRTLLGKRFENLKVFENELSDVGIHCSIQLMDEGQLVVWCALRDVANVSDFFNSRLEAVKSESMNQVVEETVCGGTRAIYGPGGVTEMLLFG